MKEQSNSQVLTVTRQENNTQLLKDRTTCKYSLLRQEEEAWLWDRPDFFSRRRPAVFFLQHAGFIIRSQVSSPHHRFHHHPTGFITTPQVLSPHYWSHHNTTGFITTPQVSSPHQRFYHCERTSFNINHRFHSEIRFYHQITCSAECWICALTDSPSPTHLSVVAFFLLQSSWSSLSSHASMSDKRFLCQTTCLQKNGCFNTLPLADW